MERYARSGWGVFSVLMLLAGCGSGTASPGDGGTDSRQDGNGGTDSGRDSGAGDAVPLGDLVVTVLDRRQTSFQLAWTSPPISAGTIAGYQVRYAKVPITSANFSDTTVATAVPYTGAPAPPDTADGLSVKGLYIETSYYFAVEATDSGGTSIWFLATTAPAIAHFNRTLLTSVSGTNEELGYSLSAEGDLNGDGLSDVLAGTYDSGRAYLSFGSATVTAGAPSVTFSGSAAGFGTSVAQIGDIDGDGLSDLAIADPLNDNKIYIYKGRTTWPMTLSDAQADYTISGDSTYAASLFGTSMARIGDFNGDGINDFAIGARNYGTFVGRVVIILGKASGFASVALPDPANSIVIDGDADFGRPFFGYRVLGLGHFYSLTTGTTLIVSAPGTPSSTTANAGNIYAFHGQIGTGGTIAIGSADAVIAGLASPARIGLVLANLGPLLGTSPALGIGNPLDALDDVGMNGTAFLTYGTSATGPFASKVVVSMAAATGVGGILVGGGLSGQDKSLSLIGDATPDLLVGAESGSTVLTISDGAKLADKTSPIELDATAEVKIPLESGWVTAEGESSLMTDVNGDGYPDICTANAAGTVPGSVAIYW